jgi:hypothetical protein
MVAEFCHGLLSITGLGDEEHVRLRTDDRLQPFTNNRVILDTQDSNSLLSHCLASAAQILDHNPYEGVAGTNVE